MPIYEYRCESCGHELEALQKMSDSPLVDCPECNDAGLKKKVSAAAFRLKGGGWYETDYKSGKKKNLASNDSSSPTSSQSDTKAPSSNGTGKPNKS
ncbi:FmdB family zinc ribbon protein [Teredinibacter haidensis]|uniref:FmdB family zinc ribbon protein n=1 Tax=Teredinibacter haidensis TaxID=2731755 RepID=UPI00094899ED|nr:zinc ribbon domain-containing protein [Teredinibacter haidensis]